MGLIKLARRILSKQHNGFWTLSSSSSYSRPATAQTAVHRYIGWVYACIFRKMGMISRVPIRLYSKGPISNFETAAVKHSRLDYITSKMNVTGSTVEVTEHPILDLINHPHPYLTFKHLLKSVVLFQDLTGAAYWRLRKDGLAGRPDRIEYLLSQYMYVDMDAKRDDVTGMLISNGDIKRYIYGLTPQNGITIPPEDIIRFFQISPTSLAYGYAPFEAANPQATLQETIVSRLQTLLDNNARPDLLIKVVGARSREEVQEFTEMWEKQFSKGGAGKVAVPEGFEDVKPIGYPPRDTSDFLVDKMTVRAIQAALGVPPTLFDISASRAEAETKKGEFLEQCIIPILDDIADALNRDLIPIFDDSGKLFLQFDDPLPPNTEVRMRERDLNIRNGYSSPNLEREWDEVPPVPWGDEPSPMSGYNKSNSHLLNPFGFMEQDAGEDASEQEEGDPPGDEPEPMPQDLGNNGKVHKARRKRDTGTLAATFQKRVEQALDKAVRAVMHETGLDKAGCGHTHTKELEDWGLWAGFSGDTRGELLMTLMLAGKDAFPDFIRMGLEQGLGKIPPLSIIVPTPDVDSFVDQYSYKFAKKVSDETEDRLRAIFQRSRNEELRPSEIRDLMEDELGFDKVRSERATRTELKRALQNGELELWKSTGVVAYKEWKTAPDCCELCARMDGTRIPLEENFFSLGDTFTTDVGSIKFNYEDIATALLHPNCRCTQIPILGEEVEKSLSRRITKCQNQ